MIITMQIVQMSNTFCVGIQEAACVLIGNKIGANDVPLAKRFAAITLFQGLAFALMVSTALFVFRVDITRVFRTEGDDGLKVHMALAVIPLFALTNIVDMCLNFFMGCVCALGIQANAALISISCFYLVSLPTASYLAF